MQCCPAPQQTSTSNVWSVPPHWGSGPSPQMGHPFTYLPQRAFPWPWIKAQSNFGQGPPSVVKPSTAPGQGSHTPSVLPETLPEIPLSLERAQALSSLGFSTLSATVSCHLFYATESYWLTWSPQRRVLWTLDPDNPWRHAPVGSSLPCLSQGENTSLVHGGDPSSGWSVCAGLIAFIISIPSRIQRRKQSRCVEGGGGGLSGGNGVGCRNLSVTCISSQLPSIGHAAGCPPWVGCIPLRWQWCWGAMSFLSSPTSLAPSLGCWKVGAVLCHTCSIFSWF